MKMRATEPGYRLSTQFSTRKLECSFQLAFISLYGEHKPSCATALIKVHLLSRGAQ